jgi:hypothetical protein
LEAAVAALKYESYDRQAALQNIERALSVLHPAVEDGSLDATQGTELMDQLAQVARQIALEALQDAEARGGDPTQIEEAQLYLEEGDALRFSGSFTEAVDKYKDALVKAEGA